MSNAAKIAAAAAAALLLLPVLIATAAGGAISAILGSSANGAGACAVTGTPTSVVAGYGPAQIANAATIVAVGKQMQIPDRGFVIAIATAMQESRLQNLDHGDRDSLGLFQQRPSQGWGTPAQITNPAYAAATFYRRLLAIPDWQTMNVNDAAQAVQRSATPNAYGQHELAARTIVTAVANATCAPPPAPTEAASKAIAFANAQIGLPYVWGGNGPNGGDPGFDCSGLTSAAYAAAGIQLPRTAHTQYHATARITEAELQPGDLVFYGNPNTKIHHVGLYIGNQQMIDAPTFGKPVGVHPIRRAPNDDLAGGGRVIQQQQPPGRIG
jgi:cell wall-associated NlpC family hydrolase